MWWDIIIDSPREFQGDKILDRIEDGGGGDYELPLGKPSIRLWEV